MRPLLSRFYLVLTGLLACWRALAGDTVVVFNEIMYHPRGSDSLEWVELYNQMAVDVELSGWEIEGIGYSFPTNTSVAGGRYIVVASDPAEMARRAPALNAANIFGPFSGKLANEGERLRLRNHNRRVMDSLEYETNRPWPAGADGTGFTLAKKAPNLASKSAENWITSLEAGGTPGSSNFSSLGSVGANVLLWEVSGATNASEFAVELFNPGSSQVDISNYELEFLHSPDLALVVPPGTTLSAGGFYLFHPKAGPLAGDKVFLYSAARRQLLDAVEIEDRPLARSESDRNSWLHPVAETPGAANRFALQTDVVISEVMFKNRAGMTNGAWVELANRGADPVDLTGWTLSGPDFFFPAGTIMQPGEYLVIAENALALRADYPAVRVLGDFTKKLSMSSDRLALLDQFGNTADEIRYFDSDPWPEFADGDASLELKDLRADNSKPEAWAASVQPGEWQSYTYSAAAAADGGPTRWNEFIFGLLDAGEVLLDDFSVIENPGASQREILQNGSFENGAATWRFLGTHRNASVIPDPDNGTNHVLRLVADGPTEHMHNHVETTLVSNLPIRNGTVYKISWRAKWLAGCSKLNTRLYFNRVARTTSLQRPLLSGTPGRPNSVAMANLGPTFSGLTHAPAVPKASEAVTVSVRADDPDGVKRSTLWWAVNGSNWVSSAMTAVGSAYSAVIPGRPAGTVVQFYIEAEDERGAVSFYPAAGRGSRALYKVNDGQSLSTRLHNFRLLMLPQEANDLHASTNVMSNGRSLCTVIHDESEIFYNCGLHLQSSERGRMDPNRVGFTVSFPADHLFRGVQNSVTFDRSGGWSGRGGRQDEIIIRHIINQAGDSPDMYNDLVRVLAPQSTYSGTAMLLMEKYGSDFIDGSIYPKDGSLHKIELIYSPTSTVGGDPQKPKIPQPDDVTGSDLGNLGSSHEAYRWFFLAENHPGEDDYDNFIRVAQAFSYSGATLQQKIADAIDVEQWARVFALKCLSGDADTYGFGLPHNQLFYVPPQGKALTFPWDLDFSWARGPTDPITLSSRIAPVLQSIPANQRLYWGNLADIINTTYNTNYMARWVAHYGTLAGQSYSGILTYIGQRAASVRTQLKAPSAFAITTAAGRDFTTNTTSLILRGTAPYTFKRLQLNFDAPGAGFSWPAVEAWEIPVALNPGRNAITITAYDFHDRPVATNSITITSGDPTHPDQDGDGMPDDWEIKYGLNPRVSDGGEDPDRDGLTNLAEYLAGTSPVDAGSNLQLLVSSTAEQQLQLSFVARAGRAYRLQYRIGLENTWRDLLTVPAAAQERVFSAPQTITPVARALFYRVLLDTAP